MRGSHVSIGAFVFQMGGGFVFRLCVCPMGGIGFDGRGDFEKKCRIGGRPLMPPFPLPPPLTMGNPVNYIYQKLE